MIEGLLVDPEDEHLLSEYNWQPVRDRHTTYAHTEIEAVNGRRRCLLLHRMIMDAPRKMLVDHRNHNGLDNRRSNLRLATQSQNHANQRKTRGVSKYKGAHWFKKDAVWHAKVRINERTIYLGSFAVEEDAARAYDQAARRYFGEFALTNFKDEEAA